jgi:hypothetical protein
MADLTPGIYRLTKDFENTTSYADKRKKHDWRARETLKAGMRFTIQADDLCGEASKPRLHLYRTRDYSSHGVWEKEELFKQLIPLLAAEAPSVDSVYARHYIDSPGSDQSFIVDVLLKQGKITLADVETAIVQRHAELDKGE